MADGRAIAGALVPELVAAGAVAVVLTGSHARGEAGEGSDVDVVVVGQGPEYLLDVREGVLIAQSWSTEADHRRHMDSPHEAGAYVPGWRDAVILHDPDGVAAGLQRNAADWTWDSIGDRADAYVTKEVTGLAEEVAKLRAALAVGRPLTAAVQRDLLAVRLARIMAVHLRLLYGSENGLHELVAERMGDNWRRAQEAAFAADHEAAIRLYRMAAGVVAPLLDVRQRAVVDLVLDA
jgi:hypothetical protein